MFYFKDKDLQQAVIERNWGGVMSEAPGDYLMIANTNIAGAKTDRVIKENILHETFVSLDGSITNRLTVTRTHTAHKNEPLVGVRNVNWLRVYVPPRVVNYLVLLDLAPLIKNILKHLMFLG